MSSGSLAGFPVVDVKATLYDGTYHDVDSSVLAFQIAARGAFRDGMRKGAVRLLEPVMKVGFGPMSRPLAPHLDPKAQLWLSGGVPSSTACVWKQPGCCSLSGRCLAASISSGACMQVHRSSGILQRATGTVSHVTRPGSGKYQTPPCL